MCQLFACPILNTIIIIISHIILAKLCSPTNKHSKPGIFHITINFFPLIVQPYELFCDCQGSWIVLISFFLLMIFIYILTLSQYLRGVNHWNTEAWGKWFVFLSMFWDVCFCGSVRSEVAWPETRVQTWGEQGLSGERVYQHRHQWKSEWGPLSRRNSSGVGGWDRERGRKRKRERDRERIVQNRLTVLLVLSLTASFTEN